MDTIRYWLDTFFTRMSPNHLIDTLYVEKKSQIQSGNDLQKLKGIGDQKLSERKIESLKNEIIQHLKDSYPTSSDDERVEIYEWGKYEAFSKTSPQNYECNTRGPFRLLRDFASDVLMIQGDGIKCKFDHILKWRMLSHRIDQDTLTCAYLADEDFHKGINRSNFSWNQVVKSDNLRLQNILNQGLAENHFHLKGSGPHFQLSWMSLMNHPTRRAKAFKEARVDQNRLSDQTFYSQLETNRRDTTEDLVLKASLIRAYISEKYIYKYSDVEKTQKLLDHSITASKSLLKLEKTNISILIDRLRFDNGFEYKGRQSERLDYLLTSKLARDNANHNLLLSSERFFLYQCFKKIYQSYSDDKQGFCEDLFYIYLSIKHQLRAELIQLNERHGFKNFSDYQDRKEMFFEESPILKDELIYMALQSTCKDQNIKSLEARLSPKRNAPELNKTIKAIDQIVNDCDRVRETIKGLKSIPSFEVDKIKLENSIVQPYFYVVHIPKSRDKISDKKLRMYQEKYLADTINIERDSYVRSSAKSTFYQLFNIRTKGAYASYRIFGIDACSNEIGCRPEAFSQSIRGIRKAVTNNLSITKLKYFDEKLPEIRITYHAGEDFLDPVDGMRAIDESIMFNDMRNGDRIGHALALGIDLEEWYACKNYNIVMSKHDYIDNLAWLYKKIIEYKLPINVFVLEEIKVKFLDVFQEVYSLPMQGNVIEIYSNAMMLRGDNPQCYKKGYYEGITFKGIWNRFNLNENTSIKNSIRGNDKHHTKESELYQRYHFNIAVRRNGMLRHSYKVNRDHIELAKMIQRKMQASVRDMGIGIECNPSSNYLIGSFKRYDKHPITVFNNLGLTVDSNALKEAPQMFVSINTDDQGVFATSLENEYALIALSLIKKKDSAGNRIYNIEMVYDWIERVRQMGIQQCFKD